MSTNPPMASSTADEELFATTSTIRLYSLSTPTIRLTDNSAHSVLYISNDSLGTLTSKEPGIPPLGGTCPKKVTALTPPKALSPI